MDISATQLLSDEDDDCDPNYLVDLPTPQKRVHQVATLQIGNQEYPIFEGINKVGRNPSSDIVIADSTVSQNHAEIEAHANLAFVCDLGSSNQSRLNDVRIRPQHFYQVKDGTQLTFGHVHARYLFLRGFDNSILVPNTPAPSKKLRRNVGNLAKNSNNISMNVGDEDVSVIKLSQPQNNDGVFAIPSPRSRRTRIQNRSHRVQIEATEISIHDLATQPYEQPEDVDESIHNCQTQRMLSGHISEKHQSIHDLETQKFDTSGEIDANAVKQNTGKLSKKIQQSIYELETQKFVSTDQQKGSNSSQKRDLLQNERISIHNMETQQLDTIVERNSEILSKECYVCEDGQQSVHDMETQKLGTIGEIHKNLDGGVAHTLFKDKTFTSGTRQSCSNANAKPLIDKKNKGECVTSQDDRVNKRSDNVVDSDTEADRAHLPTMIRSNTLLNTLSSNHIINETDDESETDEEGVFANVQVKSAKDDELKKSANKIDESDSETDEDGEFEAMRPHCATTAVNPNNSDSGKNYSSNNPIITRQIKIRNDHKPSCLSVRVDCQSPILASLDVSRVKQVENKTKDADVNSSVYEQGKIQNDEIINSDDDDDDNAPTQCQHNLGTNKAADLLHEDDDGTDEEMPPTQPKLTPNNDKSVESTKKSLHSKLISDVNDDDDDDTEPTQIIEMPRKIMSLQRTREAHDDDLEPTQVIQTSKDSMVSKRLAKSNQLRDDGDGERIACMENPRILIDINSQDEDDATQYIGESATIVTNNNERPKRTNGTERAGHMDSPRSLSNRRSDAWTDEDFDDTTPTQVIDVQAAKKHAIEELKKATAEDTKSKNVTENRISGDDNSDDENNAEKLNNKSLKRGPMKKPRISLRLQRSNNTFLNDSITRNLTNLFGDENAENKIGDSSPMATQQLQDVLENADINLNKTITPLQSANKPSSSSSHDTDSQDVYFAKLHSKRKHNVINSSQDSTESEGENDISSPTPISAIFAAGTSGFQDGVAVVTKERVGIRKSLIKKPRGGLKGQGNVKGEAITSLSDSYIVHSNNVGIVNVDNSESAVHSPVKVSGEEESPRSENDILAGLPEVRIYGTASYPASPTSSVCSLDDLEPFERKRRERLSISAAKKALTKDKSLVNVSLENVKKIESTNVTRELESSDDEELNYEDLKKMAAGFIAGDSPQRKLSIKLEKIPTTSQYYRRISEDKIKQTLVSCIEKKDVAPQKRRGRPKKINAPVLILQDEENSIAGGKSIKEVPSRKRARLQKNPINSVYSDSDPGVDSQEVQMILETSTREEEKKRIRKLPIKLRNSEVDSARDQLTPHKKRKNDVISVGSPANRRIHHKVLFTGLASSEYEAEVKLCGGTIIGRSEQATILVTDKIRRTNKFFCAISRHIPIVSETWIDDSAKHKGFLDWNDYILEDRATEAKYNFKLRETLERAKKKKLFDGFTFIVTPKVTQPGFEEIKSMVQMSGGKALVRAPKLWLPNTIIISCTDDIPKVKDILSKVSNVTSPRVHTVEFILLGILKQELDYKANQIEAFEN